MPAAPARAKSDRGEIVIPRVHLFQCGPWQGEDYTERHLREMVENFRRFSTGPNPLVHVPVVIGHEEEQDLLKNTGLPAIGYVDAVEQDGIDLFGDLSQIFPDIADLIEAGAYEHVSLEIYPPDRLPEGVPARGHMIRRAAILGGQLPHIKQLSDLPRPIRRMAERLRRRSPRVRLHASHRIFYPGSQTWACFSEVTRMAESALKEAAVAGIKAAHPDLTDEFLDSLSDDQLAMLAAPPDEAAPPDDAGATGMADPMPGMDTGAPVVWPDGKDRQAIEAELAAMGEDPAALAAMSDEDLLALYQQKAGATPMSELDPFDPLEDETVPPTTPARQPAKVTVTKQFSEEVRAEVRRLVAVETAGLRRDVQRERVQRQRQAQEARHGMIATFCERMVKQGRLTPAQVEVGKDGALIGPVVKALHAADAVRKFSDGKSALQLQMDALEALPARHFGEQVPDPVQGSAGGAMTPDRRRQLLGYTRKGKALLAKEAQQTASARTFAEALSGVLGDRLNGRS